MTDARPTVLQNAIDRAYAVFADRPAGGNFCTHCWGEDEIAHVTTTPVRQISAESARRLMWETADHWESSEVYRHYLPRILDGLAPPDPIEDILPGHLSDVLLGLAFRFWPEPERACVHEFLDAVTPLLTFCSADDEREWEKGRRKLREATPLLNSRHD